MKNLFIVLFLLTSIPVWSQDAPPTECPLSTLVQIDGVAEEWPMEWIVDADKKISYNVCSDDNNIYIRMKTSDELMRRKIALFGMTLWMDPKGKKKRNLGLHFPLGREADEQMEALSKSGEDRSKMSSSERAEFQRTMIRGLIQSAEIIELIGLADKPLTSSRSGITNGIQVAISTDEDGLTLTYEAIIPFKSYRLSKANLPVLGIGFETGKFVSKAKTSMAGTTGSNQGYSASGRGSGMYGYGGAYGGGYGNPMGGGSMGRGLGTPQRGGNNPMAVTSSYWTIIKLK